MRKHRPQAQAGSYLLDTHVWIWMVNEDIQMKRSKILPVVLEASAQGQVGISVISIWEIGILARKNRLTLIDGMRRWISTALEDDNINVLPLSVEIAMRCNELPDDFHGDPADRILVATAAVMRTTLVTCDQRILDYAKNHDFFQAQTL